MEISKELWKKSQQGPWIEEELDTEYKYELQEDGTLFLAFQGTGSIIDWKMNFDFLITPYRDMKTKWYAHRGSVKKWKIIEDEILDIIRNTNFTQIHIAGFSQGAAIAVLAHESIWFHFSEYRNITETALFGCPRVIWFWNFNQIQHRWENVTNVKTGWDIVPRVPPKLFGFKDVGQLQNIGRKWCEPSFNFVKNHFDYKNYLP